MTYTIRPVTSATTLWAKHVLTPEGWIENVSVEIADTGIISSVLANQSPSNHRTTQLDTLIPAVANVHSHAFQRALAGRTEIRSSESQDSFWSWRELMYRFLDHIEPDDCEAIAAFSQIEMLESGYTSVGEFHYLHHQANGTPYSNCAEMSERIVAASQSSGIGLTLLPVLYEQGGCDGRALRGGQKRFGHTFDDFINLHEKTSDIIAAVTNANIGVAAHSLRAVSQTSLAKAIDLFAETPFHMHIAEQQAEVDEVLAEYGVRPIEWLLDNADVRNNWCLIHATHMNINEAAQLASTGATVGLCPITESNLGDGIFKAKHYLGNDGVLSIGTDSNVRISLSEELRTLEYSQRLSAKSRVVLADEHCSNGRTLYASALQGGARALDRKTGCIAKGYQADLLSLDINAVEMLAAQHDGYLDAWIFTSDDSLVRDVWANGVHVVTGGRHIRRESIEARYRKNMQRLLAKL